VKAVIVSNGKDLPDNGNSDNDGGNDGNDNDGDDKDWAINSPDTAATAAVIAAAAAAADDDNNEGMPRKTLVTATIWRKIDTANADIPEGGAQNRPATKLRQYLSLTFEALAPPRSGCS
jgi:hypothetical protein